jgi:gamma-glutamyltranspeptidase/glutathione hydrolase
MLRARHLAVIAVIVALVPALAPGVAPARAPQAPTATPTATGAGGAIATVDPYATQAGLDVLRSGGNAVDAAVAAASVLGVVEPYSSGIGGGGFMVLHWARGNRTETIDGRETAPAAFPANAFIDPATGQPYPASAFRELATSGLAVGVPGTVRTWELALRRFGTRSLTTLMRPSIKLARNGFVVDPTLTQQTKDNLDRFNDFSSTRATYTVDGQAPQPGSVLRNPDLADTLTAIARRGSDALHEGPIARDIVAAVRTPPLVAGSARNARPGHMTTADLAGYEAKWRPPTRSSYRGLEVLGMGPPSSGGSTVGEALNILGGFTPLGADTPQALHRYLEASKLAFADRGAYLGDPDFVRVPLTGLLSAPFAADRRSLITGTALVAPVAAGDPWPYEPASAPTARGRRSGGREGRSTTHLTVRDRWGNIVTYTFTIEQTGGSGIVVPGRGFLLNNELTDFDFATGRPNSPAGGKRPRSSMSPTIVLRDGKPWLALGSPGGATIITTVLQILINRIDLGMTLPQAIAAPRASQRNTPATQAEPAFASSPEAAALASIYGHTFSSTPEIGAATGIEVLPDGSTLAAAEPVRRGGGSAMARP